MMWGRDIGEKRNTQDSHVFFGLAIEGVLIQKGKKMQRIPHLPEPAVLCWVVLDMSSHLQQLDFS